MTLDTDDAFSDDLGVSDTDVRNAVRVVFTDPETLERHAVELRDQWSIDNITGGIEKLSVLELDSTSQIDTEEEAEALANRFISDMSREFASTQLNLPFLPGLGLFSVVEMTHEKFTALPRVFAVHSIQHTFDQTRRRTVVAGVGQVVGKRRAWLHLEPRPGSPNDPRGPHQGVLPPPIVTVEQGNPGMIVTVAQARGVDARSVEIHWSLTPGFIPGPGTLKAVGTQEKWVFVSTDVSAIDHVIPGVPHHVRVRSIDSQGEPGRFTQQHTVTPTKVDPAAIVLDGNVEVTGDFHVQGENVTIDGDTTFSGNIIVRGPSGGNTGTLLFQDNAGGSLLRIGNVGGFAGAPAGAVGLAGVLGTGVWIEGAAKVIAAGYEKRNVSGTAVANQQTALGFAANIQAASVVPAGRKWVGIASVSRTFQESKNINLRFDGFEAVITASAGSYSYIIPAGSYPNIRLDGTVMVRNVSGTNISTAVQLDIGWVIIEVDA